MQKKIKILTYIIILICIIGGIKFLIYLLTDDVTRAKSPYDKVFVDIGEGEDIELQIAENNFIFVEEAVREYARQWANTDALCSASIYTNQSHDFAMYVLEYAVEYKNTYGSLYVYCDYIDDRLLISYAYTEFSYVDELMRKVFNPKEIQETYLNVTEYLEENNYYHGEGYEIHFGKNGILITIYEKNKITKEMKWENGKPKLIYR